MKKIAFYISTIIAILLLIHILIIISTGVGNLTSFGFGYLAGKIILLLIFASIAYFTRKRKLSTES